MRAILYFTIGFALQFVLWMPAYCASPPPTCPYGEELIVVSTSSTTKIDDSYDNLGSRDIGTPCMATYFTGGWSGFNYSYKTQGIINADRKCEFLFYTDTYACVQVDLASNGLQDGDEEGIDCGGSTGIDCLSSCPDGYANRDGVCTSYSYVGGEMIWYDDLITYDPIYHSPDYVVDPTTEPWQPSSNESGMVPIDPSLFVTQEKNTFTGDIIVRDSEGNITGALIIGDSQTTTNSDGTTTTTTNITEHSTSGVVSSKTVSETKDAEGNVIDKKETVTGTPSSVSLYASGKGSADGLTGDQFAAGVATLVGAIQSEGGTFTAPTESVEPGEFETIDETEYDWKASVDSYVEANDEMSWKTYFEGSGITTSGAVCDITGNVTIGSKTVPVSLSLCSYESVFQTLGYLFVTLTQLSALFIVFRGLD